MGSACREFSGRPPARATEALRQTFEALALPHLPHLYRVAARLAGNGQDAEDLVHETYVKALAAFPSLREQASIRGWLSRILRTGAGPPWRWTCA